MRKQDAANIIYESLAAALTPKGFKLRKAEEGFIRPIATGRQIIVVPLYDYNPLFEFSLTIGTRIDAVEEVFHLFSGAPPQYQKLSYTTLTQLSYFTGDNTGFKGSSSEELSTLAAQAGALILDHVIGFLDQHTTVEALDDAVNGANPSLDSTQLFSRAMHAVVLARLAENSRFPAIIASYRAQLATFPQSETDRFERLVSHLIAGPGNQ